MGSRDDAPWMPWMPWMPWVFCEGAEYESIRLPKN